MRKPTMQQSQNVYDQILSVEAKHALPQAQAMPTRKASKEKHSVVACREASGGEGESALEERIYKLFKPKPKCPCEHYVSSVSIDAKMDVQVVKASIKFSIVVLRNEATVTLLPKRVGVEDVVIESRHADVPRNDDVPADAPDEGRVVFADGATQFFTTTPGEYDVTVAVEVPYVSVLKQAVQFDSLPTASQVQLKAVLNAQRLDVSIPEAVELDTKEVGATTVVEAVIPPTAAVNVKWVKKAEERRQRKPQADSSSAAAAATPAQIAVQKKEMVVTSGQDYHVAVGGGMCFFTLEQHYTIMNGNLSKFTLEMDDVHGSAPNEQNYEEVLRGAAASRPARILDVTGKHLQSWEAVEHPDKTRGQQLKLLLSQAVEGRVSFTIQGEMEMLSTSCSIVCPTLTPLNTNRVKGNVAVQAKTAVEIAEIHSARLQKIDPSELPGKLKSVPNVLHAYKFLTPDYNLALEVTKHDDVAVLIATAEHGIYTITHTKEHLFYHMKLFIKNTQRQFARVRVPAGGTIWSALLDGEAVKPATDTAGHVLIPLRKDTPSLFTAELIFVLAADLPSPLEVMLPTIDMPVHHLTVKLWMPEDYKYSEWTGGGMNEVPFPHHGTHVPGFERRARRGPIANERFARGGSDDGAPEWAYASPALNRQYHGNTGDTGAGIRPLTFQTSPLHTGRAFALERLLLQGDEQVTLRCDTGEGSKKPPRTLAEQRGKGCIIM
eukprot:TRINITY_DN29737_c0_g1_i1.p1 TRINITY_DN29737_c0_g1~~TRINITY_DN29737_c0_g1_i1.p1  ORF type:complete len:720 (+),score=253.16 TRINITY_DN29737_c0_g1_i1:90-2249(+)